MRKKKGTLLQKSSPPATNGWLVTIIGDGELLSHDGDGN